MYGVGEATSNLKMSPIELSVKWLYKHFIVGHRRYEDRFTYCYEQQSIVELELSTIYKKTFFMSFGEEVRYERTSPIDLKRAIKMGLLF
jgi:hypothetical protein